MVTSDLIIDFVNTRDLLRDEEHLGTPEALSDWLSERGLVEAGAPATERQLDEARAVREALRVLLAAQNEVPGDVDAASAEIDRAAGRAGLIVRCEGGETKLEPSASGVEGGIGRVLVAVSNAMSDGSWSQIKACRADDCLWAFVDTAKNRSRAWCSMRSCGNRAKVRAYRARQGAAT